MRFDKSLIFLACGTFAFQVHGTSPLEAELQNLREIPIGYVAICHDGHLRIEGPNSATFWIRHAEVCAQQPKNFQFCIAGASGEDPITGLTIPNCYTLKSEVI